ncbi:hypothetical protein Vretimale_17555 [Volvox reticuliferus]|uniref:Uncharacterized protein n=1 Tax=Volvox reticuliferus TaxID=1737510 RepID=A0A8J4FG78_9CHLO|nr:hypothetical protein Vretifemale_3428 [Volvox reticuliferus]GIM14739.1 hypothetical protein Vretimale_17555 [Volvox reticuliferus]
MWIWLLSLISWGHLQLVEPIVRWWEEVVLGSWEEWLLALVRQGFEEATRFLNALGAWFLSIFSQRSYREQLRKAWQENSWQQWWGEVATRPSTLNALVASLVAQQQQETQKQQRSNTGFISPEGPAVTSTTGVAQLEVSSCQEGASSLSNPGGAAWWPRPIRHGFDSIGQLRRRGASFSARLERPVVFVQQSGMGILDELAKRRHGLLEEAKMAAQLAVSRCFELARSTVRTVLFLPARDALAAGIQRGAGAPDGGTSICAASKRPGPLATSGPAYSRVANKAHMPRSKSAHISIADMAYKPGTGAGSAFASISRRGMQRSRSYERLRSGRGTFSHYLTEAPSDVLSVIRDAGYPHELHTVTTEDGYVLRLERIPRPGARDVVFFMHGVLDTSMGWVSGGVTGSQAFAAWEAGMDVWLGNSRGNAPRQHQDPSRRGWRYWQYNINHMGMYDIAAQLDHIHNTKCAELGAGTVSLDLDHLGPLARSIFGGSGSGTFGKRTSAHGNRGFGPKLLSGRSGSMARMDGPTGAPEHPSLQSAPIGGRGCNTMRYSNSDSNLYRWGSSTSAVGIGRAAGADAVAPAGTGPSAAARCTYEATAAHLAPSTPRQISPQQQYSGAGIGATDSLTRTVSLVREVSSHGLWSPLSSSEGGECGEEAAAATAAADADGDAEIGALRRCPVFAEQRRALGLEPLGAAMDTSSEAASRLNAGRYRRPSTDGADATCESVTEEIPPSALPRRSPMPSVCQNSVTLTVMAPAAADGPPLGAAAPFSATAGEAAASAVATTFTLQVKTRGDFKVRLAAGSSPAPGGFGTPQSATQNSSADGSCGGSRGAGAAASVLEAVGSVLGPAADAVTSAVVSAGAAIATAAASATHLMHHSQKIRFSIDSPASSPLALHTSAAVPVPPPCPIPSPFAAAATQASSAYLGSPSDSLGINHALGGEAMFNPCPPLSLQLPTRLPKLMLRSTRSSCDCGISQVTAAANCPVIGTATTEVGKAELVTASPAAVAAAASLRPAATRAVLHEPSSDSHQLTGPCVRRACSSGHLDTTASEVCVAGHVVESSGGAGLRRAPLCPAAPERLSSDFSSASGRSSAIGGRAMASGLSAPAMSSDARATGAEGQAGGSQAEGLHGGGTAAEAQRRPVSSAASCPYKLRCVAHSLGGMSVLIHLINRLREGRPHNVNRLLLLTPAGFHKYCPKAARPVMWTLPIVTRMLRAVLGRSFCFPLYIPTPLGRALTFKLLLSASRIPGLGELLRLGFKALLNGDISQWDRALQLPHYSAQDMPAISVDQVLHLIQLVSTGEFRLYDYGSPAANEAHYGISLPPDVSSEYWRLDVPVHLVGGRRDGIIPPPNIHRHLEAMRAQGVAVSYREFDFGHLDFTFGVKEELRMYLMKVLRR